MSCSGKVWALMMKKRIPTIFLLISPYAYILISVLCIMHFGSLNANAMKLLISIFLGFVIVVFIPNIIYAFILVKKGECSKKLLFWDMLLKLCNIPIYVAVFVLGLILALIPMGFVFTITFAIFDYLLLLPSSMYGVSGLIRAHRENRISTAMTVVMGALHFFFCMDVIVSVIMYIIIAPQIESRYHVEGHDYKGYKNFPL